MKRSEKKIYMTITRNYDQRRVRRDTVPQQTTKTNMHDAPVCRPEERPEDSRSSGGGKRRSQTRLVTETASAL